MTEAFHRLRLIWLLAMGLLALTTGSFATNARYDGENGSSLAAKKAAPIATEPVQTTVIGRMQHLERFADDPLVDTWAKSGRIPGAGDRPVTWAENEQSLMERVWRGDKFGIATDPATLPPVRGGYIPGRPNGYFTAKELEFLQRLGIDVTPMH